MQSKAKMKYNIKSIFDQDGVLFDTDINQILYYIEEGDFERTTNKGTRDEMTYTTVGQNDQHVTFIKDLFAKTDQALAVSFVETKKDKQADISISLVDSNTEEGWDEDTLGTAYFEDNWVNILWQDDDGKYKTFSKNDKATLVHEIGHALGIDHPEGDGDHPDWNTDITVMSYEKGRKGWPTSFRDLDIKALQSIWGEAPGDTIPGGNSNSESIGIIQGTNQRDKLVGTNGDDEIYGHRGSDIINAKAGDDVIYPGDFGKKKDVIRTGPGKDVVVLDEDSYVYITDFKTGSDEIDVTDLSNPDTWTQGNSTYIGNDDYIYAILKGKNHDLILEDGFFF